MYSGHSECSECPVSLHSHWSINMSSVFSMMRMDAETQHRKLMTVTEQKVSVNNWHIGGAKRSSEDRGSNGSS